VKPHPRVRCSVVHPIGNGRATGLRGLIWHRGVSRHGVMESSGVITRYWIEVLRFALFDSRRNVGGAGRVERAACDVSNGRDLLLSNIILASNPHLVPFGGCRYAVIHVGSYPVSFVRRLVAGVEFFCMPNGSTGSYWPQPPNRPTRNKVQAVAKASSRVLSQVASTTQWSTISRSCAREAYGGIVSTRMPTAKVTSKYPGF
jgi:hypothetical protein